MIADIAGWATEGKLDIVTGIPLAICGTDKVSGKITVSPMDMLPLFRRGGTGPTVMKLLRIKPERLTGEIHDTLVQGFTSVVMAARRARR